MSNCILTCGCEQVKCWVTDRYVGNDIRLCSWVTPQCLHTCLILSCDQAVIMALILDLVVLLQQPSQKWDIILRSSVNQVNLDIEFVIKSFHKVAKWLKGTEKEAMENVTEDVWTWRRQKKNGRRQTAELWRSYDGRTMGEILQLNSWHFKNEASHAKAKLVCSVWAELCVQCYSCLKKKRVLCAEAHLPQHVCRCNYWLCWQHC